MAPRLVVFDESIDFSLENAVPDPVPFEQRLREEYAHQQKMDEMRLVFAKKAEALNRAMEERVDTFSEIFVVDTVAEAEQQVAEIDGYRESLEALQCDLDAIAAYAEEMGSMRKIGRASCRERV